MKVSSQLNRRFLSTVFDSGKALTAARRIRLAQVSARYRALVAGQWEKPPAKRRLDQAVISLTSWAPRLGVLPLTLMTLLEQSVSPLRIEVWLCSDDLSRLDPQVKSLFTEAGVHFRNSVDYGPHKKWLNAIIEADDRSVVTADDDILYSGVWLERLFDDLPASHDASVAHRCHQIVCDSSGQIESYDRWKKSVKAFGEKSFSLFATGGAGQILRRAWFEDRFLNPASIMKLCPTADDLWINCALRAAGVPVVRSNTFLPLLEIEAAQESSLLQLNVHKGRNDLQLQAIMDFYGLSTSTFFPYAEKGPGGATRLQFSAE